MILASASPRRREMLTALGIGYKAVATEVEELREGGEAEALVVENARRKALAGLKLVGGGEGDLALGVDTEVVVDEGLLGKAASVGEAQSHLLALSGRTHEVLSGVSLIEVVNLANEEHRLRRPARTETLPKAPDSSPAAPTPSSSERSGVASSLVTFNALDEPTLERYLASGEWRDRAGAYAIQGLGSLLIARVEGDFSNVVGLPLQLLITLAPELFDPVSSGSVGSREKSRGRVYP